MRKTKLVGRSVNKHSVVKTVRRTARAIGAKATVSRARSESLTPLAGDAISFVSRTGSNDVAQNGGAIKSASGLDLTEKFRELLVIAKEQGHLTSDDIDEAFVDCAILPEDLDQIHSRLNNLDIKIVDQAEADGGRQPETEAEADAEEDQKVRFDGLDDPVRMYMRQMAKCRR